jgi:hypothetical protein
VEGLGDLASNTQYRRHKSKLVHHREAAEFVCKVAIEGSR